MAIFDPEIVAPSCLRSLRACATDEQFTESCDKIKEAIHQAFDLGHKAAGGSIAPDVMGGGPWKYIEIAMDRAEIDAVCDMIDHHLAGQNADVAPSSDMAALRRFMDKIIFFRRHKIFRSQE